MAQYTTTFTRFDAIGVKEDLSDIISNISPTDTPVLTSAGKGKVKNTLFEWQTDALAAAVTTNQQLEGDDAPTIAARTPTVRLGNYVEIARKLQSVSGTMEATDTAGRESEVGYQLAMNGKELKRDMESSLCANKGASAGSTSAARKTAGLLAFIKTNISKASDGTAPVYTTTPTDVWTDGTARAFTETILKSVIQQCFTSGGTPTTIMVAPFNKTVFSSFPGILELTSAQTRTGQATIVGAADTYRSDFGLLTTVVNRFQRTSTAFVMDWDYVSVEYLRPYQTFDLAKTGDASRKELLAEYGLRVKNEKAIGAAVDLTSS